MVAEPGERSADPRAVLLVTCLATAAVWMATSAAPVVVPDIGRALAASQSELQWVVDLFPLTLAALLLPGGSAVDRFGRRRGMLVGLVVMAGGQVASAWAGSIGMLILARAITGVGAALVFPATLATITSVLPEERRPRAVSYWTASVLLGGFAGMFVASVLQGVLWWGALFAIGAVATLVLAVLVALVIPESADPAHAGRDLGGVLLSIVAIGGIVFGITEGPSHGWTSPPTVVAFVLGGACLLLFVPWELRAPRPLLDLRVFRDRRTAAATLALVVAFAADFGMMFTLFQVLPITRGYDAMAVTGTILPGGLALLPAVVVGARAHVRFGLGPVLLVGGLVCSAGLALLAAVAHADTGPGALLGAAVFVAGVGFLMPAATRSITESLPRSQQGVASALNDLGRELGAAVGIAVFGSLLKVGYQVRIDDRAADLPSGAADVARSSPIAGIELVAPLGVAGLDVIQGAVAVGWQLATSVAAIGVGVFAVVGAALAGRRKPEPVVDVATPTLLGYGPDRTT